MSQALAEDERADAPVLHPVGLRDFQRRRKAGSLERLLAAALEAFCERGYFTVSVEEITSAAGVSRMTFYRHFSGKPAIAAELFRRNAEAAMPHLLAIGLRDYRDRRVVAAWIGELFASDRARRQILRVFTQALADAPAFTRAAHDFMRAVIAGLGEMIPAFAVDEADPADRRRWIEAWLVIYEILDQSNHAAMESGVAADPLIVEVLADRFLAFVTRAEAG